MCWLNRKARMRNQGREDKLEEKLMGGKWVWKPLGKRNGGMAGILGGRQVSQEGRLIDQLGKATLTERGMGAHELI